MQVNLKSLRRTASIASTQLRVLMGNTSFGGLPSQSGMRDWMKRRMLSTTGETENMIPTILKTETARLMKTT